jgi:tetratricopeptide (TPR) repeat protein
MSSAQDRVRALAIAQDFGALALELNRQLVESNPADLASRTRLGRCYLEAGRLEESEAEYREVLQADPKNRIAAGGLEAIERQRRAAELAAAGLAAPVRRTERVQRVARAPRVRDAKPRREPGSSVLASLGPVPAVFGGFEARDFIELNLCPRGEVQARFAPRVVDLIRRLNALPSAVEIAAVREPGRRQLFRLSRAEVHARAGHWSVASAGGRWEPQFNVGMYGGRERSSDWLRVGLGFDLSDSGRDADVEAGLRQVREWFKRFQGLLASPRRSLLSGWLIKEGGYVECDGSGPRADFTEASQAAEWLASADPSRLGWVFAGKWLSPARPDDAVILADPVSLVRTIDRVFIGLLPLWRALYE